MEEFPSMVQNFSNFMRLSKRTSKSDQIIGPISHIDTKMWFLIYCCSHLSRVISSEQMIL
jgi:hypothetical protein